LLLGFAIEQGSGNPCVQSGEETIASWRYRLKSGLYKNKTRGYLSFKTVLVDEANDARRHLMIVASWLSMCGHWKSLRLTHAALYVINTKS